MSVMIIAEAGVNHNGDINIAKKLIDAAKQAGADVVKFQTFNAKRLATPSATLAEYQRYNIGHEESQLDMLSRLMLKNSEYKELADYCKTVGISFLSTPFDIDSASFLNRLQDMWKIPSGEITNYPYLVELAKTGKKILLSTGMSMMDEVDEAINLLRTNGSGEITLLHCTTNYPASYNDVNLKAMLTMRDHCGCPVGYSDHTKGIEVSIAAAALGATVIEKHFTLDRSMEGPDHRASVEPHELKAMIESIRNIETAMGDGVKRPSEAEKPILNIVRKSIIASRDIKAGEILSEHNLTTKRPGDGINPMKWKDVLGTKAVRDFAEDELIVL